MFNTLIETVLDMVRNLVWLLLAMVTGIAIHSIRLMAFNLDLLVHGLVVAAVAGLTTAVWAGAVRNAGP